MAWLDCNTNTVHFRLTFTAESPTYEVYPVSLLITDLRKFWNRSVKHDAAILPVFSSDSSSTHSPIYLFIHSFFQELSHIRALFSIYPRYVPALPPTPKRVPSIHSYVHTYSRMCVCVHSHRCILSSSVPFIPVYIIVQSEMSINVNVKEKCRNLF